MSVVIPSRLKSWMRSAAPGWIGPVTRSDNDYATHMPVLIGLARRCSIRSILELGCGQYSTSTFLNRRVFANLEVLDSYETDHSWAMALKEVTKDPRANMHMVAGTMASAIEGANLSTYDLIFVDDSTTEQERVMTIRSLSQRRPATSLVVVHDFEIDSYIRAASGFRHRYAFKAFNPETGVLWESGSTRREVFKEIDSVIKQHARNLQPDDVEAWLQVFS
ncbi:MAG TPA: hypothetical protein VF251_08080 [Pyrinomonadaceae bacterium]